MKPIALFDMDGTIADYSWELDKRLKEMAAPGESLPDGFNWDNTEPHWQARMQIVKNNPGFWINLPRLEPGYTLLHKAYEMGFQIEVLTKGPRHCPVAWKEKLEWCEANIKVPFQLTITMNKGLVYGKVLVDDYQPYIESWLAWRKRGHVIMPNHTWNTDFEHKQVSRMNNIDDGISVLQKIL